MALSEGVVELGRRSATYSFPPDDWYLAKGDRGRKRSPPYENVANLELDGDLTSQAAPEQEEEDARHYDVPIHRHEPSDNAAQSINARVLFVLRMQLINFLVVVVAIIAVVAVLLVTIYGQRNCVISPEGEASGGDVQENTTWTMGTIIT